jgi:uncharacterized SAM-binding protein YcdF (DUF218 family)
MTYTEPLFLCFSLLALAGVLVRRRALTLAGILGLIVMTCPAADWLFSRPLESAYPVRPFEPPPEIQAIAVFSGGVSPPLFERPFPEPNRDTIERCEYAAWIYRKHPMPILACGGASPDGGSSFSSVMRDWLRRDGVPDNMIWTEEESQDTHQNALFGAEILRSHGIERVALVVDARSMMRASACLRKQGIQVAPAPSRFRQWGTWGEELLPNWKGLRDNEATLHETVGLLWYRIRGWI